MQTIISPIAGINAMKIETVVSKLKEAVRGIYCKGCFDGCDLCMRDTNNCHTCENTRVFEDMDGYEKPCHDCECETVTKSQD